MATSFTLATLKTRIQNHAEDQGSEFAGELDTLIQLGEDAIVRDLPLSIFDSRNAISIVAGTPTASKPADTIAVRELYYTSGGTRTVLLPRSYSYCLDYAPTTTQGAPKYFADEYSETELYIAPNPNLTVTAEAYITKRPASLVTSTSGTFISKNLGDLLLAACMVAAERYIVALDQEADWKAAYQSALLSAAVDLRHLIRRDYSMMAPTPKAAGNPER